MSDEAERLRDAIKEAVHWPNPPTPLARDFCRVVVAELGITEEDVSEMRTARLSYENSARNKAADIYATLLEVANG